MKNMSEKSKDSNYVKPALVVYGDFAQITKLTGSGSRVDAAFQVGDIATFLS